MFKRTLSSTQESRPKKKVPNDVLETKAYGRDLHFLWVISKKRYIGKNPVRLIIRSFLTIGQSSE